MNNQSPQMSIGVAGMLRKNWFLLLCSSLGLFAVITVYCVLYMDSLLVIFLPFMLLSVAVGIPTVLVTGLPFSTAGYFLLVSGIVWISSVLVGVLVLVFVVPFSTGIGVGLIGASACVGFCACYEMVFFERHYLLSNLSALVIGFLVFFGIAEIGSGEDGRQVNIGLWFTAFGLSVSVSLYRQLKRRIESSHQ